MDLDFSFCISRFTPWDFQFIEEKLSIRLSPEEKNQDHSRLLDWLGDPELLRALTGDAHPLSVSPELYFLVLVRHSLIESGITDESVIDYVAATLARHGAPGDYPFPSFERPDSDFTYHLDFVEAMEGLRGYDRFFLQVQCGNQFMVMTGLFPGFIEERSRRRGAPGISYYEGVARQAFLAAGDHPLAEEFRLRRMYPRLADCLPETRQALNRMADHYLFLGS